MEADEIRCWDELLPDALGLIFSHLSLQEILTVVTRVCKSWSKAVMGPYCWQEIDIEEWSYVSEPSNIDRMVRMLIARSSGSLRRLRVSGLQDDHIFSFILDHSPRLTTLHLPRSVMSDSIVKEYAIAGRLSMITFMDLSYCIKLGASALEAIGNNCKCLSELRRNMHPLDTQGKVSMNDEAHAIAATMPKLRRLEMAYLLVDTPTVVEILMGCKELELLDIRGCWNVKIGRSWLREKFPAVVVKGPYVYDEYVGHDFSDSEDSVDEGSWDGMWDSDGLEFMIYQGLDDDSVYGWPPSP